MSSASGSGSESSRSASSSPAHSNDGSVAAASHGSRRSMHSRSPSVNSNKSGGSGSRSASSGSQQSHRSRSPSRGPSRPSSARSHSSGRSASRSQSGTPEHSGRSRSQSHVSDRSAHSRSRSRGSAHSQGSGSRSPGSEHSGRSGSQSQGSGRSSRSDVSRSRSRSRSGSHASRSSIGRDITRNPSPPNSSRSPVRGSARSNSRSPAALEIDESQDGRNKSGSSDDENEGSDYGEEVKANGDQETKEGDKVSAAAIFGDDADDISSEDEGRDKGEESTEKPIEDDKEMHSDDDARSEERDVARVGSDEDAHESDSEVQRVGDQIDQEDEEDNEAEVIPDTRIDVEIPKISCDLGRDLYFVKLPNFLSVETRPFDPETYEDEIDEEETLDEEGRARLKLKVENTIRWRDCSTTEVPSEETDTIYGGRQSNARLVRWSDGSYSLHLGSEIFDVYKQPLQGDHNHLFIRQGTGLQGQAVFRTKLSFRPHSTESFTHRKMTLSLADRSQKTSGIKILSQVGLDPDHDRKTLLKKEEEKLRQAPRTSTSKSRKKESHGGAPRSHNISSYRADEDGSDEEGAISISAIKNKYKAISSAAVKGGAIYSSDEEGSDIEARRSRKADKTKAIKDSESSGEASE